MQGTAPVLAVMTKADSRTQDIVQVTHLPLTAPLPPTLQIAHTTSVQARSQQCFTMGWASQAAATTTELRPLPLLRGITHHTLLHALHHAHHIHATLLSNGPWPWGLHVCVCVCHILHPTIP